MNLVDELHAITAALPMTFDAGTARERHVQRVTKIDGDHHLVVDLMLDEAALAGFLDDRIEVDLPEGRLRVVSRAGLLAMKRMAARPQDDADVERLESGDGD